MQHDMRADAGTAEAKLGAAVLAALSVLPHDSAHPNEHIHAESRVETTAEAGDLMRAYDGLSLELRTGEPPAELAGPSVGTCLARFPIRVGGTGDGEIAASGTARHFRVLNSAHVPVFQGPVTSNPEAPADALFMDNSVCVSGGRVCVRADAS